MFCYGLWHGIRRLLYSTHWLDRMVQRVVSVHPGHGHPLRVGASRLDGLLHCLYTLIHVIVHQNQVTKGLVGGQDWVRLSLDSFHSVRLGNAKQRDGKTTRVRSHMQVLQSFRRQCTVRFFFFSFLCNVFLWQKKQEIEHTWFPLVGAMNTTRGAKSGVLRSFSVCVSEKMHFNLG